VLVVAILAGAVLFLCNPSESPRIALGNLSEESLCMAFREAVLNDDMERFEAVVAEIANRKEFLRGGRRAIEGKLGRPSSLRKAFLDPDEDTSISISGTVRDFFRLKADCLLYTVYNANSDMMETFGITVYKDNVVWTRYQRIIGNHIVRNEVIRFGEK
jgi:hypothetical protein